VNIGILGAGGWGLTLALMLKREAHVVRVWDPSTKYVRKLQRERVNDQGLPGVRIPDDVRIVTDIGEALEAVHLVVFPGPSHVAGKVARAASSHDLSGALAVSVAKGIENDTLRRMSEILTEEVEGLVEDRVVVLSGPCIAREVHRGVPTAVAAASRSVEAAEQVQRIFMTNTFRVYTSDDVPGVELGGSLKNVIALAAGICDGLNYGSNTKGALITRGLAEITRLGVALGATPSTFAGLSGMGDLVATCTSPDSRNRGVGEQIGMGRKVEDVLGGMVMTAEGVRTTRAAVQLARRTEVEMPITQQMQEVLFHGKSPQRAVSDLMSRGAKPEIWD